MSSIICARRGYRVGELLEMAGFESLATELYRWRADPQITVHEREKRSGIVLGFVKGLRLSAKLIYIIRTLLSATALEVDWGHLLDKSEDSLSPECDIIIHQKGHHARWNGDSNAPIMDFKFIKCDNAVAVISCKSLVKSVDRKYCTLLKPYVKDVLIFAECCHNRSIRTLGEKASKAGYAGFWYLYSLDETTNEMTTDPNVWLEFIKKLKGLCRKWSRD